MTAATDTTINTVLRDAMAQLAPGSDSPSLDAHLLLACVLDKPRSYLLAHADDGLARSNREQFRKLVARRSAGEPVAYLLGERGFWTLDLHVSSAVLVPRPETEILVETALACLPAETPARIADLGTGSGAIALALASERPDCDIIATDFDTQTLAVARDNAQRLGLSRLEWRLGEWFEPLDGERFDLIASNPPYVAPDDPHLADLGHEPRAALVAADKGRACLRHLAEYARDYLQPGGWLLLEHGLDQAPFVHQSLTRAGFGAITTQPDLAGHPRVTFGRLPT